MKYPVSVTPEFKQEVLEGHRWYQGKARGLGDAFSRMVVAAIEGDCDFPFSNRKAHGDFRRCLLRRFPYAIYYRIDMDAIWIYGLFHCARDQHAIRRILRKRR